jgi:hypothetical protein
MSAPWSDDSLDFRRLIFINLLLCVGFPCVQVVDIYQPAVCASFLRALGVCARLIKYQLQHLQVEFLAIYT